MYEHSFTIEDVAWLLSIRRLDDGTRQDFPVECPFCGDTRGKCSFCISKNGEQKNVYHCFHCDASGNMLSLYADLMGFYGADRYKEAYQDILRRLERKRTCFPKMKASTFLKPKEKLQSPEYLDYVYRNMLALLELKEVHKKDLKRRSLTEWEIQELMDKGYRSTEPEKSVWIAKKLLENGLTLKGVPGFFQNRDGNWEAAFYEGNRGYLCPVYSIDGKILGFQIRVEKPVNNRKYVWFTGSGLEGGTSSKSPAGVSGFAKVGITSIRVTEGILKAEIASLRSGHPYIGIPGVGNYRSLQPVLSDLKQRGLKTVYECMDMDKMMSLTCQEDSGTKCESCLDKKAFSGMQECPHKRLKRDTIRKGCLKVYQVCEELGLNCYRVTWDTDANGIWQNQYKGVDDWILGKSPQERLEMK